MATETITACDNEKCNNRITDPRDGIVLETWSGVTIMTQDESYHDTKNKLWCRECLENLIRMNIYHKQDIDALKKKLCTIAETL